MGITLYQFVAVIFVFIVLTVIGILLRNQLKKWFSGSVKVNDLLPDDEVHTLRQVFYLIMMALSIVNVFYSLTLGMQDIYYFIIFDILLSLYFAVTLDTSTWKGKIIWLILVPYASISFLMFDLNLVIILDLIHVLVFIYFAKVNFDKFMEYTNSNGLGITIILLFLIIFLSFFITQYAENVNALDSLVIISNQFTGNGFAVFGDTIPGKLNSLLLVWGGYVISGVGAATLTAAILMKHFNKRFKELERLIEGDDE
ncbi:MAG: hypothetical protein BZ138_03100 [Methanosphaera sp. rholeuAM270]|nr:MAG: hypothetical protein BZ138_03100 [Methanosphaera sp. rholeuAM270]